MSHSVSHYQKCFKVRQCIESAYIRRPHGIPSGFHTVESNQKWNLREWHYYCHFRSLNPLFWVAWSGSLPRKNDDFRIETGYKVYIINSDRIRMKNMIRSIYHRQSASLNSENKSQDMNRKSGSPRCARLGEVYSLGPLAN